MRSPLSEATDTSDTEAPGAPSAADEARLTLGSILEDRIEDIPHMHAALRLASLHKALGNLVGVHSEDIVIRGAVLYSLQHAGPALDAQARDAVLWWLPEAPRETALKNLREGGWIEHTEEGWVFTQLGHDLYQVVELLFHIDKRKDMTFGSVILRALKELSGDRYYALRGLVTQVQTMERSLERARQSHSSVIMEGEIERCGQARRIVQDVLREVQPLLTDPTAATAIQELHRANARMMGALTRLQEALAEVTSQHAILPSGYTPHDITMSLMSMPLEALAARGDTAIRPIHARRRVIREELLAYAAANYLDKERPPKPERPAKAKPATQNPGFKPPTDPRVDAFLAELRELPGDEVPLERILHGENAEILMRFANLPQLNANLPEDRASPFGSLPWRYEQRPGHTKHAKGPVRISPNSVLRRKTHGR